MRRKQFSFPVNPLVGSSFSNIIALLKRHEVDLVYYPKFILTLIIAGIFEIFNLYESIRLKKKLKETPFREPPVFIIGFWRSGTTLLHNLMCCDPRAGYTTTFQVVFPHSTITQAWWLKKLTNILLPPSRPFDNISMDMDFPQEEEYGMTAMQPDSLYNIFTFPRDFDSIVMNEFYTGKFKPDQLKRWQKNYLRLMKKAMLNTSGERYISKNPCSLGRIELLLSMFPDAKFIFIYRSPYQVAESLYRFMLAIFPGTQLQGVPGDFNREKIVKLYAEIMNQYFLSRPAIPQGQLIEIKMEDMVRDKFRYLERIYSDLKISGFEQAKPYFRDYLSGISDYSREPYDVPEETYHLMNQYASDIITSLGYEIQEG
jgi:hypothetical protein